MRRSLMLNEGLNNQLEHEVQVIEAAQEDAVARHFAEVRAWRVKLSDADALNWTAIEGLSILVFLLVLLRVIYMPSADVGTIFAIFVYVWRLMEKLDLMPQIVQQLMRLKDIRRRIEAGASIEAVGEQIRAHRPRQERAALTAAAPAESTAPRRDGYRDDPQKRFSSAAR